MFDTVYQSSVPTALRAVAASGNRLQLPDLSMSSPDSIGDALTVYLASGLPTATQV